MKVSIVGPTGYTGRELIRILLKHNDVSKIFLFGRREIFINEEFPEFTEVFEEKVNPIDAKKIAEKSDVVFIALPHKASMEISSSIRNEKSGLKIVDLSADYRLEDEIMYEKAYGVKHIDFSSVKKYVYGLCEANRKAIAKSDYVANPGCYPTSILIPLLPLLENNIKLGSVIADSKSGASGAGKSLSKKLHFTECNENFSPYKIFRHQHRYEMMQFFYKYAKEIDFVFTPHLLPLERGILSVIYVENIEKIKSDNIIELYDNRFKSEPFVRIIKGADPNLHMVRNTNYCDIALYFSDESRYFIIVSAIDNLVKGASGQAVQNMNIMFGIDEKRGLI